MKRALLSSRRLAGRSWSILSTLSAPSPQPESVRFQDAPSPPSATFRRSQPSPGSSQSRRYLSNTSNHVTLVDFFGEPVTFLEKSAASSSAAAMERLDTFVVAIVSKGKSCTGGGDDQGLAAKAAHACAIAWANLLRVAATAPIMAVAAVGPMLVQADVGYLRAIDQLLAHAEGGKVQLLELARQAVSFKEDGRLTLREQWHLQALDHLLQGERKEAMTILLKLLQQCPGDALALSMIMDLACTMSDRKMALTAAGSVATYWRERQTSIAGFSIGSSLIALGLVAGGGRIAEAERMAQQALSQDVNGCGGVATWALAHVYDAEGRISEGISMLAGFDGVDNYDESGLLFFDSRLGGYGARFTLDREGAEGGRTSLRMYDTNFDRVIEYSGYGEGIPWQKPQRRAPKARSQVMAESAGSFLQSLFGEEKEDKNQNADQETQQVTSESARIEDVLSWLPPSPQLLTDSTLLLLRLTLNHTIDPNDPRWARLQNAWLSLLDTYSANDAIRLPPLAVLSASLVCETKLLGELSPELQDLSDGMQSVGLLLGLCDTTHTIQQIEETRAICKTLVEQFAGSSILDDMWDMDSRPITAHAVCYAAAESEDYASLCVARAVCSEGVCLRPNSPEEWWRYSVILEKMGDEVAAEDARSASRSMGSGEGGSLG